MTEAAQISELQQRVNAIEVRFSGSVEESRERSERLSSLLEAMEEGFARSRRDFERLNDELVRVSEENQQLRGMLQTLLAVTDDSTVRGIGAAMRELETRINRLVDTASSISGTLGQSPSDMVRDSSPSTDRILPVCGPSRH